LYRQKPPEHILALRKFQNGYANHIYKTTGLSCLRWGESEEAQEDGLLFLSFDLWSPQSLDSSEISKAKDLAVSCMGILLEMINSNQEVRPYLANWPLDHETIRVSITFDIGEKADEIAKPIFEVIVNNSGLVITAKERQTYRFVEIAREPYLKSLKKI